MHTSYQQQDWGGSHTKQKRRVVSERPRQCLLQGAYAVNPQHLSSNWHCSLRTVRGQGRAHCGEELATVMMTVVRMGCLLPL